MGRAQRHPSRGILRDARDGAIIFTSRRMRGSTRYPSGRSRTQISWPVVDDWWSVTDLGVLERYFLGPHLHVADWAGQRERCMDARQQHGPPIARYSAVTDAAVRVNSSYGRLLSRVSPMPSYEGLTNSTLLGWLAERMERFAEGLKAFAQRLPYYPGAHHPDGQLGRAFTHA